MNVKELVGYHILTGVDRDVFHNCGYFNDTDANVIIFELDGISYIAKEDPDDGYRSYCEDLEIYNKKPKNTFPAVQVECVHIERSEYDGECDILKFVDCKNNKVILRIGTDYLDDYYPCCVFEWHPENMDINKNVKIEEENDDLKRLSAEDLIYELLYWNEQMRLYSLRDDSIVWSQEKESEVEARCFDVKDEIIARCMKGEQKCLK